MPKVRNKCIIIMTYERSEEHLEGKYTINRIHTYSYTLNHMVTLECRASTTIAVLYKLPHTPETTCSSNSWSLCGVQTFRSVLLTS